MQIFQGREVLQGAPNLPENFYGSLTPVSFQGNVLTCLTIVSLLFKYMQVYEIKGT